ncbi:MAG TPA: hypothetical protein VGE39_01150 [Prosthecobacter sp.]
MLALQPSPRFTARAGFLPVLEMLRAAGLGLPWLCPRLLMSPPQTSQPPVIPLLTKEQMERILSSRRSITSEEAYQQIATHMGRPRSPGRKKVSVNGQDVWVCC